MRDTQHPISRRLIQGLTNAWAFNSAAATLIGEAHFLSHKGTILELNIVTDEVFVMALSGWSYHQTAVFPL